jgi:hypothetical protein
MYEFSATAWAKCENSFGCPSLLTGIDEDIAILVFSGIAFVIGVSKIPGAIDAILIPYYPNSLAIGNVIPTIAPFDAE